MLGRSRNLLKGLLRRATVQYAKPQKTFEVDWQAIRPKCGWPARGARPRRGFTIARASIVRTRAMVQPRAQRRDDVHCATRLWWTRCCTKKSLRVGCQWRRAKSLHVQQQSTIPPGPRFLLTCTRQPLTLQQSTVFGFLV
jgi:hypothetical protein